MEAVRPAAARGWLRALALFGAVLALSVVRPGVLVAVPLLLILLLRRARGGAALALWVLAVLVVGSGVQDGLWFVERAWALLLAGSFTALTLALPELRLSTRTLGAVLGAAAAGAALLAVRSGAWAALDWAIQEGVWAAVASTVDALSVLREGRPLSPAFAAAMYELAETQAAVFPAMLSLASMAALGVAWWIVSRVAGDEGPGLGPVSGFRFNDHLVWLLIGGLLLLVTRWGDALTRVGANAVVFMGGLYALRGAGVFLFVSGGLSFVGYALFALGVFFAAPVVLGVAIVIGIGDTWLDLRARAGGPAA